MDGLDPGRLDPGRLDTRRADTRGLDAGRADTRGPTAGPSGRRPQVTGHRTAGQPDPRRRTRMGGHRMLDTDRRPTPWLACWQCRSRRRRPTAGCGPDAPPGRRRLARTTRTAQQNGLRGHPRCYGRAWSPPRPSAAGATPPSSWRLGALLSCVLDLDGTSGGQWDEGKVGCAGSGWWGHADGGAVG
jgi:hypothetical protein